MPKRARDSQQSKVYKWEHQSKLIRQAERVSWEYDPVKKKHIERREWHSHALTLAQCRALAARIVRDHGFVVEKMGVFVGDGRRSRNAHANARDIALPRWARSFEVLCHEVAHLLMQRTASGSLYAAHGPEFVRLYINLLAKYGPYQRGALVKSARQYGVKVATKYPGGCW